MISKQIICCCRALVLCWT